MYKVLSAADSHLLCYVCWAASNETIKVPADKHKSQLNTCINKAKVYENKVPPDSKTT